MSTGDRDLSQLFGDLTTAVEQLQEQLETERGPPRPPTPRQLAEFTSEVTIPALILVLETNVRALRLVQWALRIAEGRETDRQPSQARKRATDLGRATLSRLDDTLSDLATNLEDTSTDDETRELLERIRELESDIDTRLAAEPETSDHEEAADTVDIDVDAELQSIKDDVDDDSSHEGN